MRIITKDFFKTSSIPQNKDTERAMDFLAHPKNIEKMILATENGKPALSAVVADLEDLLSSSEEFPLSHDAEDCNAQNRRNIGWMIRYIMREYGYVPLENVGRTRIGSKSGSKYFQSAALYKKCGDVKKIHTRTYHKTYNWKECSMFASEADVDYAFLKTKMNRLLTAIDKLNIGKERVLNVMNETGYGDYTYNLIDILTGKKVPCIEVLEDIDETVQLLVFADGKSEYLLALIKSGAVLDIGHTTTDMFIMKESNKNAEN